MHCNDIENRLKILIKKVTEESVKNLDRWYPLDLLGELQAMLCNTSDVNGILYQISMIKYYMMDQFHSYHDTVFSSVMEFCLNIETLFAIDAAIESLATSSEIISHPHMEKLLDEWRDSFSCNGSIDEDINTKFRHEFATLMEDQPSLFENKFPQFVIRIFKVK